MEVRDAVPAAQTAFRTVAALVLTVALTAAAAISQTIEDQLDALVRNGRLAGSGCVTGVVIMDADSGRLLASSNAEASLIPASNMKLLSSGAALAILGTDFSFRTELLADASRNRLIVVGAGDPAFGDPALLKDMNIGVDQFVNLWAESVRKAGIKSVSELVIDDRVFDREFVHPTWPTGQLNRWYCAEVSGLTFHTNLLTVYTRPTEPGRPPTLRIEPNAPWIDIRNRARSVDKGQQTAWAARDLRSNDITLYGDVRWATDPVRVTLHDNAAFFGRLFAERLGAAGISVNTVRLATEQENLTGGTPIHAVQTPISTVLRRANVDSHNLYSECLIKRLGYQMTQSPGSWKTGAAIMRMVLLERLGAASGKDVTVADGSGMSRENRVTPRMLADWLVSFHRDERLRDHFISTLPLAGGEGTLERRFRNVKLRNEVRAKSGYLTGVSALSGYVTDTNSGRRVAFSIITNEKPNKVPLAWVREFEEQVVVMADQWLTRQTASTASATDER